MYPVLRLLIELFVSRNDAPMPPDGVHVSHHTCMPWDLDLWMELNNGRTLTLYDLGRIPFARRAGLIGALRRRKWGLTMAGASVRYRRRVKIFDRIEMRSTCLGRDDRFFYIHQAMYVRDHPTSSILYRSAVTDRKGIVATDTVADEMGLSDWNPVMPNWAQSWIEAEALRPWPPELDAP